MRCLVLIALALPLTACQPDMRPELEQLRAELRRQDAEIARLSVFVDRQADVLRVCQETVAQFMDYVVNLSTLGMLREASTQLENAGKCTDAIEAFNAIATTRRDQ